LIYWDLFLASQYIKYHCSNQIFRNTFQSNLKIKIRTSIDQIESSIKSRTIIPILSKTEMLYINIRDYIQVRVDYIQSQGGRLTTHGSYQILRTKEEEEENMNCVCSRLQLYSRCVVLLQIPQLPHSSDSRSIYTPERSRSSYLSLAWARQNTSS